MILCAEEEEVKKKGGTWFANQRKKMKNWLGFYLQSRLGAFAERLFSD